MELQLGKMAAGLGHEVCEVGDAWGGGEDQARKVGEGRAGAKGACGGERGQRGPAARAAGGVAPVSLAPRAVLVGGHLLDRDSWGSSVGETFKA